MSQNSHTSNQHHHHHHHHSLGESFHRCTNKVSSLLSRKPSTSNTAINTSQRDSKDQNPLLPPDSGRNEEMPALPKNKKQGLSILTNIKTKVTSPTPSPRSSSLKKTKKEAEELREKRKGGHKRSASAFPSLSTFKIDEASSPASNTIALSSSSNDKYSSSSAENQENSSSVSRIPMIRRMSDGSTRTVAVRGGRRASVGNQDNSRSTSISNENQFKELFPASRMHLPDERTQASTSRRGIDSTKRGNPATLAHRRQTSMPIQMLPSRSFTSLKDFQLQYPKIPPTSENPVQKMSKGSPVANGDMKTPFFALSNTEGKREHHKRSFSGRSAGTFGREEVERSASTSVGSEVSSVSNSKLATEFSTPTQETKSQPLNSSPFKGSPSAWSPSLLSTSFSSPRTTRPLPTPILKRSHSSSTYSSNSFDSFRSTSTSPTHSLREFKMSSLSTPFSMKTLKKKCSFDSQVLNISLAEPISPELLKRLRPLSADKNRESTSGTRCPDNSPTDPIFPGGVSNDVEEESTEEMDNTSSSNRDQNSKAFSKIKGFSQSRPILKPLEIKSKAKPLQESTTSPSFSPTRRHSSSAGLQTSIGDSVEWSLDSTDSAKVDQDFDSTSPDSTDSSVTFSRWQVDSFSPDRQGSDSKLHLASISHLPESPMSSPCGKMRAIREEKEVEEQEDLMERFGRSIRARAASDSACGSGEIKESYDLSMSWSSSI